MLNDIAIVSDSSRAEWWNLTGNSVSQYSTIRLVNIDDTPPHTLKLEKRRKMEQLLNQNVVVDVESMFVYLGQLTEVSDKTLTLVKADVHDLRDSNTTRERYILDSKMDGIRANRERVLIQRCGVVSISALDDVMV